MSEPKNANQEKPEIQDLPAEAKELTGDEARQVQGGMMPRVTGDEVTTQSGTRPDYT